MIFIMWRFIVRLLHSGHRGSAKVLLIRSPGLYDCATYIWRPYNLFKALSPTSFNRLSQKFPILRGLCDNSIFLRVSPKVSDELKTPQKTGIFIVPSQCLLSISVHKGEALRIGPGCLSVCLSVFVFPSVTCMPITQQRKVAESLNLVRFMHWCIDSLILRSKVQSSRWWGQRTAAGPGLHMQKRKITKTSKFCVHFHGTRSRRYYFEVKR